jgi:CubicO group peptidase (beta-lactamase class C family)
MYGAGELAMTARDLAKWDVAMIDRIVLRPASWKQLETSVLRNDGVSTGYGLGVNVGLMNGHRLVTHSGEVAGFTAQNFVFPDDSAAVVVLVNQDAASSAGMIARQISMSLFRNQDAKSEAYTARARRIFDGLQKGTIDRSLFTANANSYFTDQALRDFAASLAPLGTPTSFVQVHEEGRGGMIERSYQVTFPTRSVLSCRPIQE